MGLTGKMDHWATIIIPPINPIKPISPIKRKKNNK